MQSIVGLFPNWGGQGCQGEQGIEEEGEGWKSHVGEGGSYLYGYILFLTVDCKFSANNNICKIMDNFHHDMIVYIVFHMIPL